MASYTCSTPTFTGTPVTPTFTGTPLTVALSRGVKAGDTANTPTDLYLKFVAASAPVRLAIW